MYKAAIFDMDGTILDTIGDITDSLNYALGKLGYKHDFTTQIVTEFVGSGINIEIKRCIAYQKGLDVDKLIEVGTENDPADDLVSDEEIEKVKEVLEPYYAEHCSIKTGPYDGIIDLIKELRERGSITVVVSNKPDEAVRTLSNEVFGGLFDISLGEKPGIARKPAPDMTDIVLRELGLKKEEVVYIGDSEIDIETAENSGVDCICVDWGFRGRKFLEARGAETIVERPADILTFFGKNC